MNLYRKIPALLLKLKYLTSSLQFVLSLVGATIIHFLTLFIKPPQQLPDFFPVLFAGYSCGHFLLGWLFFNYVQLGDLAFEIKCIAEDEGENKKDT